MEIGRLRHSVVVQNPGASRPDSDGGFTQGAYVDLAPVWWAEIRPATARDLEREVAGTVLSTATHLVRMRYLPGVTTQTRILFGSRVFEVISVQNKDERNIELMLVCVEVVL